MSRYGVKEVFRTIQGEGTRVGTKAVFVRFTGCNLWDGMPLHRDRGEGSCAKWCDTDFFKGSVMGVDDLLTVMQQAWGADEVADPWVVFTGGEPCLQLDEELLATLKAEGWSIAIETNGTVANDAVAKYADWICIAPKLGTDGEALTLLMSRVDEIKVVIPGAIPGEPGWGEPQLADLAAAWPDAQLFLQPQDPLVSSNFVEETALKRSIAVQPDVEAELADRWKRHVKRCVDIIMGNSRWRMSLQTHKFMGLA